MMASFSLRDIFCFENLCVSCVCHVCALTFDMDITNGMF